MQTQMRFRFLCALLVVLVCISAVWGADSGSHAQAPPFQATADNPNPPSVPVKLIFIHHSTGENWLADNSGRLGITLRDNNYFVSDTNYGWGPDGIGDLTDIGHWWLWFVSLRRDTYTAALYREYAQHASYARLPTDPGGENQIILFKSCFPNSDVDGNPTDPPTVGDNPLRGESSPLTVGNAKGIYNDLLTYFSTRRDKLFIAITAPPLVSAATDAQHAANARALNNWLVHDWLASYPYNNVAVFDFFNVLTSNGGNANAHDLGALTGNHHRWRNGAIEHMQNLANNYSAYGSSSDDSHPTPAGGQKASAEFVQLLNIYYHRWAGAQGTVTPGMPTRTPTRTYTPTATRTASPSVSPTRGASRTPTRTSTTNSMQRPRLWLPLCLRNHARATPQPSATPEIWPTATPTQEEPTALVIQRGTRGDVADAYVWESSPDYTGNWETLYTGCVGWGRKKTLLRFDLSSLSPSVQVQRATLAIWLQWGTESRQVYVHRLRMDWDEESINWNSLESHYATSPLGSFTTDEAEWREVDITDLARGWLDGSIPNQGILLDDPTAGTDQNEEYYSSEWEEIQQRPKLVLMVSGE